MVYNDYVKLRILYLDKLGFHPTNIAAALAEEHIRVTDKGVAKFIAIFKASGKHIVQVSVVLNLFCSRYYSKKSWQ